MPITERQRPLQRSSGRVVAFDFDGTLTVDDSFTAFLRWREGGWGYSTRMASLAPSAARFLIDRNHGRLKSRVVRKFLRGLPKGVLEAEAVEFATAAAPLMLRPDALKSWRRHRNDGARMIIVTASPEILVAPFARGLGAEMVLGTGLATDKDDRLTGGLMGPNCRGPEKARRIRQVFGDDVRLAAAYGDTDGDKEMLEMAEERFMRIFVARPGRGRPVT